MKKKIVTILSCVILALLGTMFFLVSLTVSLKKQGGSAYENNTNSNTQDQGLASPTPIAPQCTERGY